MDKILFEGFITKEVITEIATQMAAEGIPYRFGDYQGSDTDWSFFKERQGRIYMHTATYPVGISETKEVKTWGYIDERYLTKEKRSKDEQDR